MTQVAAPLLETRPAGVTGARASLLTPQQVLYMEDGDKKRCGRCAMLLKDTGGCSIIGERVDPADGVCELYVHGEPMSREDHGPKMPEMGMKLVPKDVAGYGAARGQGGYSCGNCRWGSGSPRCLHPHLSGFPIDNAGGCCNAWAAGPDGLAEENRARMFEGGPGSNQYEEKPGGVEPAAGAGDRKAKREKPKVKVGGKDVEIGTRKDPEGGAARQVVVGGVHVADVTDAYSPLMVPGASYSYGKERYRSIKYRREGLEKLGIDPERAKRLTGAPARAKTNWGVINNISRDLEDPWQRKEVEAELVAGEAKDAKGHGSEKRGGRSKFAPAGHEPDEPVRVETPGQRAARIRGMKVNPERAAVIRRAIGQREARAVLVA